MKTIYTAAALSMLAACSTAPQSTVAVPESLKTGRDETLAMIVPAKGVQIYECRAGQWAFVAPEADLFNADGQKIGRHYAGPSWEAADGSRIVGAVKAKAEAPEMSSIPWLLLGTKSTGGPGTFSNVTSVQRVSTVGGIAPARDCVDGARARMSYTADYYFFTGRQ